MMNKKKEIIFITIFMMTISLFICTIFIRGQKEISVIENKTLMKIPTPSVDSYMQGKFQEDLETGIIDQFLFGEEIKFTFSKTQASLINKFQKDIMTFFSQKNTTTNYHNSKSYIPISQDVYTYKNDNYMIFKPRTFNENLKKDINHFTTMYNQKLKDVESYFYFINQSKSIDFDHINNDIYEYIEKKLQFTGSSCLKINSYEQYKDYFYQTDHHWNYKGSYQGYKDIIQMIYPNDQVLEPVNTKTFDTYFYGSNARKTSLYTNKEKFTVHQFQTKEHDTYINGQKTQYGNEESYFSGHYSTVDGYNHYRDFYGGDFAEVIYDYKQEDKDNLLIIAPSYSNAINKLIASHFSKTYIVDLRYNQSFDIDSYMKEKNIDKVLVMLSVDHMTSGDFDLED